MYLGSFAEPISTISPNELDPSGPSTSSGTRRVIHYNESSEDLLLGIASYLFCALCPNGDVALPNEEMQQHFIDAHVDDSKYGNVRTPL